MLHHPSTGLLDGIVVEFTVEGAPILRDQTHADQGCLLMQPGKLSVKKDSHSHGKICGLSHSQDLRTE
jgi:hypothetical protein